MNINGNDNGQQEKIIKKGFLYKKSRYLGVWKRRYIVLTQNYIFAYVDDHPNSECTMNLTVADSFGPKHLQLENENEFGFSFSNEGVVYCFKTNNREEKNAWFNSFRETLSY